MKKLVEEHARPRTTRAMRGAGGCAGGCAGGSTADDAAGLLSLMTEQKCTPRRLGESDGEGEGVEATAGTAGGFGSGGGGAADWLPEGVAMAGGAGVATPSELQPNASAEGTGAEGTGVEGTGAGAEGTGAGAGAPASDAGEGEEAPSLLLSASRIV